MSRGSPFLPLRRECTISGDLLKYVQREDAPWRVVQGLDVTPIPKILIQTDPTLSELADIFDCTNKLSVMRFHPNSFYNWHNDSAKRMVALNLVLDGWDSFTLFGTSYPPDWHKNTVKVPYAPGRMILMDTLKPHCVSNFSEVRYLFSMGFRFPITFDQIADYVRSNEL